MVICLERGADFHMAQQIPLSLASVKSRLVLPFWYRLTQVVPDRGPFNGCVCPWEWCIVLVCLSVHLHISKIVSKFTKFLYTIGYNIECYRIFLYITVCCVVLVSCMLSCLHIATYPTIQQPGFHLPRHTQSLMNRFWTGQGSCCANLHKRGLTQSPSCDCGQRQTTNHVVDTCPSTKLEGGKKRMLMQSYCCNRQRLQHSRNNK